MVGDSMAFDEWPAVATAMNAGKISIAGYVSPGAGLLDTRYDSTTEIDKMVVDFKPDLVLYQGSLWDSGTPDAQRAAYDATDLVLGQEPDLRSSPSCRCEPTTRTLRELGREIAGNSTTSPANTREVIVANATGVGGRCSY